ncbi:helix-turn-helix domain-containing protein [Streptomyces griseoluteus]|uniref:helix-turn-helix domain-containing protein n=1 Tax=Streptomyces griseoluteus TaxID=29306 RepID=UPI003691BE15
MSRWRPLPDDLPPPVRRLAEELRLHKDRSRLTLPSLAAKTSHSRSSWHRYLHGRALPPWPAVEGLGTVAQADRERLRVLWESASDAWEPKPSDRTRTPVNDGLKPAAPADKKASHTAGSARAVAATGRERGRAPADAAAPRVLRHVLAVSVVVAACGLLAAILLLRSAVRGDASNDVSKGSPEGTPAWPWALNTASMPAGGAACTGRGCQGQDPYREKCDRDRSTIHALGAYGHRLLLQYSRACQTVWAEVEPAKGTTWLVVATVASTTRAAPGASRTAMITLDQLQAHACVETERHQLCVTQHDSWLRPVSARGRG